MPRAARLVLPDCAHHVIQRGHNRDAVFVQNRDYLRYLENLAEWQAYFGCKVYGFCLMTKSRAFGRGPRAESGKPRAADEALGWTSAVPNP